MASLFDFLNKMVGSKTQWGGLDPLTQAQIMQESGGDPNALSPKGAAGIMQIMPATARQPGYGVKPLQGWDGVDPRTAPVDEQIRFGRDYTSAMKNKFGTNEDALAAYNAGPGRMERVNQGKASMPAETENYVSNIMGKLAQAPKKGDEWQPGSAGIFLNNKIAQAPKKTSPAIEGKYAASNGGFNESPPQIAQADTTQSDGPSLLSNPELWKYLGRVGTGMAAASGPSDKPVSFGQVMAGGMEYADKKAKEDRELDIKEQLLSVRQQSSGGATMAAYEMLKEQYPDADPMMLFRLAQNKIGINQTMDPKTGQVTEMPGAPTAMGNLAYGEQSGKNAADLTGKPQIEAEITRQRDLAERQKNYSKAQSSLTSFEQQAKIVDDNIKKAKAAISPWSTGYGSYLSGLPNTDARQLEGYLKTIKTNVGLDKLQNMREMSPTGGALGNVSDTENELLQAVNGALDPGQADLLKENLEQIEKLYPLVLQERKRAFQQDFGMLSPLGNNPVETAPPALTPGQTPKAGPQEGAVAINPTTGERLIRRNGQWVKQ